MYAFRRLALFCITLLVFTTVKAGVAEINFSLIDHEDKKFHMRDLRGKVVLVFFGYTHCPDVCPIELQHMASALKRLGDKAINARGLFITVDPEYDTPEVLSRYLEYFDAGLIGLTGSQQQIESVAKLFSVNYKKIFRGNDQYSMDHTANLFVIDQTGKLNTIVPFGFPAAHIELLLRNLIAVDE